ncbi:MAG TPA: 23S rRNA (adenine(2503)-C(2))-methyltransferase RlmN [Syntrophorhabdus sp.]|jgi:23S rRNA (adenine2503-C2)-methyltransferase|nr:23S rRNA (adenine(2503)-C(2))-methyltransferase RlmN [Syntrophorhabdus sp.]MBP8745890.1 23S rRNA (adenine(2503)-C(2))-methyltransferase RlmN [Syntrophorhabdus sp.]HQG26543.1 23S rRNA (adenine(2503)-C(2))-methyltransferase RlmN [Syntrophorhabdus sp.]HQH83730.1 23S rRNA (adenine(2503)-C(2))-methyltransferase RlmN [Syntrophorhabdus sp.]HQI97355.1 23S rRNA (adenine(2503)-C(2))-methyltransferase RlmN [Syntrophorhabdus sp.]
MQNFFELTLHQLENAIGAIGNEKFRARQLYKWIYNKGVFDFHEMTNISKSLRLIFKDMFCTDPPEIKDILRSNDGTIKFGITASDGRTMESVLIPEKGRNTLCLSSQIGCRMGCKFCVTGKIGFVRNLTSAEIIGQIMAVKRYLGEQKITNIVFMGMGEPVDNLDTLLHTLEIMKNPLGLDFSHRRITVSSVGLLEGLRTLEPKVTGLAISLNAADDGKRTYLMPINRLYPIRDIIGFVREFRGSKRVRITFEYVLIKGFNDSLDDAQQLAQLLTGVKCKINLIPFNESPYVEFKTPDTKAVNQFHDYLLQRHFTAIVRDSRGQDIGAACGQLGARYLGTVQEIS